MTNRKYVHVSVGICLILGALLLQIFVYRGGAVPPARMDTRETTVPLADSDGVERVAREVVVC